MDRLKTLNEALKGTRIFKLQHKIEFNYYTFCSKGFLVPIVFNIYFLSYYMSTQKNVR